MSEGKLDEHNENYGRYYPCSLGEEITVTERGVEIIMESVAYSADYKHHNPLHNPAHGPCKDKDQNGIYPGEQRFVVLLPDDGQKEIVNIHHQTGYGIGVFRGMRCELHFRKLVHGLGHLVCMWNHIIQIKVEQMFYSGIRINLSFLF
nr:hypothetical protein Muribac2_190 [uncultured Muribaculaceae bacterium]